MKVEIFVETIQKVWETYAYR